VCLSRVALTVVQIVHSSAFAVATLDDQNDNVDQRSNDQQQRSGRSHLYLQNHVEVTRRLLFLNLNYFQLCARTICGAQPDLENVQSRRRRIVLVAERSCSSSVHWSSCS
jgi:hypothetical protein